MINGRSHITVMVLALVRDSTTCKLRHGEGGPGEGCREKLLRGVGGGGGGGGLSDQMYELT